MIGKITERFDQSFLEPLIAMEKTLLAAASAEDMADDLKIIEESVFGKDFDFPRLTRQLKILPDIVKQALPEVKKVTSIRTLCTAMATDNHRKTFSELNKLLPLYLTVPVTSATSEREFSALRRLLTYLCSSMTEQRLNNCSLLHVHKDLVDDLPIEKIAAEFAAANNQRSQYFGSFQ